MNMMAGGNSMDKVAIALNDVTFSYKRNSGSVFSNLSLSIRENEVTCILGHNGAGKTTLLRLMYGIYRCQSGNVSICAQGVGSYSDIFYYSNNDGHSRNLSTRELVRFKELAFQKQHDTETLNQLIGRFRFAGLLETPLNELSSGNRARAAFILGLSFVPSLLLLDEPTNSIDPETRECLKCLLRHQKSRGSTAVVVTHDLEFAHEVSDRAFVMKQGRIVREDDRIGSMSRKDFVDQYIRYTTDGEDDV